ncbi:MAG: hypothetical protein RQ756_05275, partial [Flavobacteriaceae bacterium]|nr:hypothetical protein [Flavobacteriaceae bacterium]
SMGAQQGMQEDLSMLRQILNNLVVFSFSEEELLDYFNEHYFTHFNFGNKLKEQRPLIELFRHVDDSLFALSLRNPMIGVKVNEEISNVYDNLENAFDDYAQNRMSRGASNHQFALMATNELAYLLSQTQKEMENSLALPGQGKEPGEGFQLPDIIKKQESLSEEGEKGSDGEQGNEGESGQSGQSGQSGNQGSQSGDSNQSGGEGKGGDQQGQQGQNGNQGAGGNQSQGNNPDSYSEKMSERLFEIFKEQQDLRFQLEDKIRELGLDEKYRKLSEDMKSVENKLLDQGFNREVARQMKQISHELLKLEDARLQQSEDEKRESNSNENQFNNNANQLPEQIRKYFNDVEILNRQALPLRPEYLKKVKRYFEAT